MDDLHTSLDHRHLPPLGMTGAQFNRAAIDTVKDIEEYYTSLEHRSVVPAVTPGYLRNLLPTEPPQDGEAWDDIAKDMESKIMIGMTHWQSPKFMSFFPASSSYPGILGELWSAALTVPAFNWICSPVVTELETIVLDWIASMLALPKAFASQGEGGGVIQGSASEAIVVVMVAARERYVRRQIEREGLTDLEDIEDRSSMIRAQLVALGSEQSHSSTKKAAAVAGTRYRSIATTRADDFALTGKAVRAKIEEMEARNLHPYYLTVTVGSTNTCAIDDLVSIAAVAKDYPDIWIHCDAAYAGAALVCPEYQYLSEQIAFVDSFNFNMHKWLLTNFDASCLFVQKRKELTSALSVTPAYLKNDFSDKGLVTDYRDWQIPLGRRFRSLKLWFVLRTWGVNGLREHIRHHIRLGNFFEDLIRSRSDLFEILTQPRFALTVFNVKSKEIMIDRNGEAHLGTAQACSENDQQTSEDANACTAEVFARVEASREFFLTSTVIDDTFAIRVVSANPLAEQKYVRQCFDQLVEFAESLRCRRV
jgi:aromatic-L-amino-acid decarboxylase